MPAVERPNPLAFVAPIVTAAVGLATLPVLLGLAGSVRAMQEGGWFAWFVLAAFAFCAVFQVMIVAVGRPLGGLVALSAAPWLLGLVGTLMGQRMIAQALAAVDPSMAGTLFLAGTAETMVTRALGGWASAFLAMGGGIAVLLRDRSRWSLATLGAALALCALFAALAAMTLRTGLGAVVNAPPDMRMMLLASALSKLWLYEILRLAAFVLMAVGALVALLVSETRPDGRAGAALAVVAALVVGFADVGVVLKSRGAAQAVASMRDTDRGGFEALVLRGPSHNRPQARVVPGKSVDASQLDDASGTFTIEVDRRTDGATLQAFFDAAARASIERVEIVGSRPPPSREVMAAAGIHAVYVALAARGPGAIEVQTSVGLPEDVLRATVRTGAPLALESRPGEVVETVPLGGPSVEGRGRRVLLTLAPSVTASHVVQAVAALQDSDFVVAVGQSDPPDQETVEGLGEYGLTGVSGVVGLENVGSVSHDADARRKVRPKVVPGRSQVRGTLDKNIIQRVVRAHRAKIRYCYERELVKQPKLAGKVVTSFVVSAQGSVSSATVKKSTLGSKGAEQCIVSALKRMKFPKPNGGGIVMITYPFIFSPG